MSSWGRRVVGNFLFGLTVFFAALTSSKNLALTTNSHWHRAGESTDPAHQIDQNQLIYGMWNLSQNFLILMVTLKWGYHDYYERLTSSAASFTLKACLDLKSGFDSQWSCSNERWIQSRIDRHIFLFFTTDGGLPAWQGVAICSIWTRRTERDSIEKYFPCATGTLFVLLWRFTVSSRIKEISGELECDSEHRTLKRLLGDSWAWKAAISEGARSLRTGFSWWWAKEMWEALCWLIRWLA